MSLGLMDGIEDHPGPLYGEKTWLVPQPCQLPTPVRLQREKEIVPFHRGTAHDVENVLEIGRVTTEGMRRELFDQILAITMDLPQGEGGESWIHA
jgi:hypothetical protein